MLADSPKKWGGGICARKSLYNNILQGFIGRMFISCLFLYLGIYEHNFNNHLF